MHQSSLILWSWLNVYGRIKLLHQPMLQTRMALDHCWCIVRVVSAEVERLLHLIVLGSISRADQCQAQSLLRLLLLPPLLLVVVVVVVRGLAALRAQV